MNYTSEQAQEYGNIYKVYVLTFPNGKRYVGMTRQDIKVRWHGGSGYKNAKTLYQAILEAKWENVQKEIVADNLSSIEAGELEKRLIECYETTNPNKGYNRMKGGQTGCHSETFKSDLSKRMKGNTYCVGRKISEDHLKALIEGRKRVHKPSPLIGRKQPEEMKQHLSQKAKERWQNPVMRQKYLDSKKDMTGKNNPMYGRTQSDETRRKISEKAKGRVITAETRQKLIEGHKKHRKKVAQYDLNGNLVCIFDSLELAGVAVNGNGTNISFACKNPLRSYKGFRWRYEENDNNMC